MTPIETRRLTPDDWRGFRDIRLTALRDAPYAFGSTYATSSQYTETVWRSRLLAAAYFVAVQGERSVGLIGGLPLEANPGTALLISMWVAPELRGQGVGSALVERVIAWAHEQGFARLELEVTPGNDEAERLYTRCGFIRTGYRADATDHGLPNIIMERLLDS